MSAGDPTTLLAHQGGWDEVLYFVVPAIAVIVWVRWAERRARARRGPGDEGHRPGTGPTDED